jgi:hypothetical protein
VRLARRAADVDAVRARPRDDRQAAGALIAAGGGAGVAEQRIAHAPRGHGVRQRRGRDELIPLAVGEDQHRARVACDQRGRLRGRADGNLVGRAGRVGAQIARQRGDARSRQRPGPPRRLDAPPHRAHGRGERKGEDHAQGRGTRDLHPPPARTDGERDARPQAPGHGGIQAGQIARAQAGHRAAQRDAGDEPEPEREQPAAADPIQAAPAAQRQGDGERRQRGNRLDADPPAQVGVCGEQSQRPGRRRAASDRGRVLAGATGQRARLARGRPRGRAQRDVCAGCVPDRVPTAPQPRDPVVDERRAPGRAVGGAERPRPGMQRHHADGHQPGQRAGDEGAAEQTEAARSGPALARAGDEPQPRGRADRHDGLGELDLEGQPQQRARPSQGPQAPAARRPCDHRGARHRQRGHDRVHRVAAGHDHGRRRHGQRQPAGKRRGAPQDRPQQPHERGDERDAAQRRGQQQRHAVEAEQPGGRDLEPQVHRGLVDRHPAAGLERTAQERGPGGAHAAHCGVVVRVGGDAAERCQAQERRQRQDGGLRPHVAPGAAHWLLH